MRAPVDHIAAPPFPPRLEWVNDRAEGLPMLVEFWDFCRVQSLRTLPYMKAWRERYPDLTVVGVHAAGFPPSQRPRGGAGRGRSGWRVPYPVAIDTEFDVWELYGNLGWPARYLFDQRGMLLHYHYGEGGYDETERAIQEVLGLDQALLAPFRPEETPDALLEPQTDDVEGPVLGPVHGRRRVGGARRERDGRGQRAHDRRRPSRRVRADRA